ncbi:zinc finger, CCHC-type containing protein [Tanacetum coccineum]|uniref:Zinc finger, CCHC-type containing protein n=1 Tax=Tanacetum coccineum TaxID=301880 RepID=A0ABQ4Z6C2_9ASTR
MDTACRTSWIRRVGCPGYDISDILGTTYQTYWVRRIRPIGYGILGSLGTAYWLIGYDVLYILASNWLERLSAGSITTWEDLTTLFLAQFFPPGRTAKLCNNILMFQQHHGESLSEAWTSFKDLL